jgi:hypothetical protein
VLLLTKGQVIADAVRLGAPRFFSPCHIFVNLDDHMLLFLSQYNRKIPNDMRFLVV